MRHSAAVRHAISIGARGCSPPGLPRGPLAFGEPPSCKKAYAGRRTGRPGRRTATTLEVLRAIEFRGAAFVGTMTFAMGDSVQTISAPQAPKF